MAITCFAYACVLYRRMSRDGKIGNFAGVKMLFLKYLVKTKKEEDLKNDKMSGPIEMSLIKQTL